MKRHLLLIILLLICAIANAQEYAVGVRGGFNYYNIGDIQSRIENLPGSSSDLYTPNKEIGTQFGGYVTIGFEKIYIRPEINYVSSKNNYEFPDKTAAWKTSKIDIPILFGYQLFDPISLYIGPGINIFNETVLEGVQVTSYSDGGPDLDKVTFNINIGVMLKYNRFGLDLRYEIGLNETDEELLDIIKSTYGVNLVDLKPYRPSLLSLSLFIDIIRTNGDDFDGLFSGLFKKKCYCPY